MHYSPPYCYVKVYWCEHRNDLRSVRVHLKNQIEIITASMYLFNWAYQKWWMNKWYYRSINIELYILLRFMNITRIRAIYLFVNSSCENVWQIPSPDDKLNSSIFIFRMKLKCIDAWKKCLKSIMHFLEDFIVIQQWFRVQTNKIPVSISELEICSYTKNTNCWCDALCTTTVKFPAPIFLILYRTKGM